VEPRETAGGQTAPEELAKFLFDEPGKPLAASRTRGLCQERPRDVQESRGGGRSGSASSARRPWRGLPRRTTRAARAVPATARSDSTGFPRERKPGRSGMAGTAYEPATRAGRKSVRGSDETNEGRQGSNPADWRADESAGRDLRMPSPQLPLEVTGPAPSPSMLARCVRRPPIPYTMRMSGTNHAGLSRVQNRVQNQVALSQRSATLHSMNGAFSTTSQKFCGWNSATLRSPRR